MKRFICPYCFEKHSVNTCAIRCSYDAGIGRACCKGVVKDANGYVPDNKKAYCLRCSHARKAIICPVTEKEIPSECVTAEGLPIALIGAGGSAKSSYLAVLISEIQKKMMSSYPCVLNTVVNEETKDTYHYVYKEPLFRLNRMLDKTNDIYPVPPLIFPLTFIKRKRKVVLTFCDTAGNKLCSREDIEIMNRYLGNAGGIILMIDPLQIRSVRERLAGKMMLPPENTDVCRILGNVIGIISSLNNIKPQQKIDIPIAVAITKLDLLEECGLISSDGILSRESEHVTRGAYVLSESQGVRRELEGVLNELISDELLAYLAKFKHREIFGIAPLGCAPDRYGNIGKDGIRPRRVLDPFLWILSERGYVKRVK